MKNEVNKQLPFSHEAEQAVRGAILIDPENFKDVNMILRSDDFYLEEHKNIYKAMHTLDLVHNTTIDVVTLINTLVEVGVYHEASGKE